MRKGRILLLVLLSMFMANFANAQLVAFSGAEGYGKHTTGGRGTNVAGVKIAIDPQVVFVTTLEDNADGEPLIEGSFRWALAEQDTLINERINFKIPTTIMFKVGGVIRLKQDIHTAVRNLTIAGQTAPGEGITFANGTLNFSGSVNLIVRYIRSRPGDALGEETSAFRIENGKDFIIDHCSFSWAIEETTHFSSNENSTVQWSIISESLYRSIHKKGDRGYGTQWGGEYASYHHNLLAHHNSRMPRINGSNSNDKNALVDYRNNVNYNWANAGAFYGGEWEATGGNGFCHTNVVNNYFKPGPGLSGTEYFCKPSYNRTGVEVDGYGKWFINGNVMEGDAGKTSANWTGVSTSVVGSEENIRSDVEFMKTDGVIENYENYTETAEAAYLSVLETVGVSYPKRGPHDIRLIEELKGEREIIRYDYSENGVNTPTFTKSAGIIDTQNNLVSTEDQNAGKDAWDVYETVNSDQAPVDTDGDGIPDTWETSNGLDPNNSKDGLTFNEAGYLWLEQYLASLLGENLPNEKREIAQSAEVTCFPNPTKNTVTFNSKERIESISIFDLSGREIAFNKVQNKHVAIDLSAYDIGYYHFWVKLSNGSSRKIKVLKK